MEFFIKLERLWFYYDHSDNENILKLWRGKDKLNWIIFIDEKWSRYTLLFIVFDSTDLSYYCKIRVDRQRSTAMHDRGGSWHCRSGRKSLDSCFIRGHNLVPALVQLVDRAVPELLQAVPSALGSDEHVRIGMLQERISAQNERLDEASRDEPLHTNTK